jgi:hypothetical protein
MIYLFSSKPPSPNSLLTSPKVTQHGYTTCPTALFGRRPTPFPACKGSSRYLRFSTN